MKKVLLKEKVMIFLLLLYFHGFDKLLYLILGKITSKTEVKFLLSGLFNTFTLKPNTVVPSRQPM